MEQALSYVLAIYEKGHFREELAAVLGQSREMLVSSPNDLRARLEDLRVRVREEEEAAREESSEDVGSLSLSDFFDEAPMHSEAIDEELEASEDLVSMEFEDMTGEEGAGEFSFADLGGELSFENLNFNFEEEAEGGDSIDLLDDIWPEDELSLLEDVEMPANVDEIPLLEEVDEVSEEPSGSVGEPVDEKSPDYQGFFDELDDQAHWFSPPEPAVEPSDEALSGEAQESSVAFELVEIDPGERFKLHDSPGISGRSETHDEDIFDVFNSLERDPLEEEQGAREEKEEEPEVVPDVSPAPFAPPTHHEPEPSPSLSFSFDFDDDEEEEEAPEEPEAPTPVHQVESSPEPVVVPEPPVSTHPQDERAPSLGFGDLSFDSFLEEEEVERPQAQATPEPVHRLPLPPKIDQPTRQVDVESEEIGSLLSEPAKQAPEQPLAVEQANVEEMSRETRAMPAVDRDLVNPFASEDDAFGASDWNFDEGPAAMPGLHDDWLEQEPVPEDRVPSHMRDVHNDATAIPGLNASNSGLPFNPYRHESERSRHPSVAPHTRSSPGLSSPGESSRGGRSVPPQSLSSSSPALRQTRENQEIYREDESSRGAVSNTQEHDYEQLANMLKDTQERNQPTASASSSSPPSPEQASHEEDDFDLFDLGFQAPRIEEVQPAAVPPTSRGDASSSELKLPTPPVIQVEGQSAVKSTMYGAPFIAPPVNAALDDMPTPLPPAGSSSAAEDMTEDEFFALAESIAAENSVAFDAEPAIEIEDAPTHQGEKQRGRLNTLPVSNSGLKPPPNPFQGPTSTGLHMPTLEPSVRPMMFGDSEEDELSVDVSMQEVPSPESLYEKAEIAYDLGRFEDALELSISLKGGEYDSQARALIVKIEEGLERSQLERIGSLSRTPVLDVPLGQLASLDLDHRAGFLLSQIDGFLTFEDLLDLSAMPRLETIVVLADLLDRSIIKTI